MKSRIYSVLFLGLLFTSSLVSCSKSDSDGEKAKLQLRLIDAPADYDQVNIDIKDVQINVTGDDDKGWQSLPGVKAGIYNILDLVNGKDTLLVDADIPTGKLHQIRLILGDNNSVVMGGVSAHLETPSAQQSGLKLNVQQDVKSGILYTMVLDFDAARSIVTTGSGKYNLKPVIRTVLNAVGGSIKGAVTPGSLLTAVYAINGTDTISTFTDATGGYLIRGVPAATYNMLFKATDLTYQQQTKTGIAVTTGNVTVVDTVRLQK
ncbi:hypothetical protein A4H97_14335 [Niastella yeongjuensis]|uniref:DUF4382 domain-containing protein n=1 Tax=Niastella yeongjuensis TaxID=354355 RepID=A0A1V9E3X2_9BACT|nr:DUF4382 domain-containing protein [Niastella yeongjuensis]OQP40789.1 hypothetical protein A4H97_14335 [Niastella yeongjuensis]SEP01634.1 protein of unknown function [Niastella yeongjuensis]